jgi:hypothetical protein
MMIINGAMDLFLGDILGKGGNGGGGVRINRWLLRLHYGMASQRDGVTVGGVARKTSGNRQVIEAWYQSAGSYY